MNKYKKLVSNTLIFAIGSFGSKILLLLLTRLYTGNINPGDNSTKELLEQTANFLIPIITFSIADAVIRYGIDKNFDNRKIFTSACVTEAFGIGVLLLLSPLLAVLALVVKLDSPQGPVFFAQKRVGHHGSTFSMYKFRSMVPNAEELKAQLMDRNEGQGVLFKIADDPRVTRVGRFMRRYSLDELPQLWNVLTGNMPLVGPRPPLDDEVRRYEEDVHRRLLVKPGITGLWQVSGRSDLSWEESTRLDLYYVENWSVIGDIIVLCKTVRAVFTAVGAH